MSLRSVFLATASLCAYVADAHMTMEKPVPFSVDKLDNGPINQLQFPCKNTLGYTVSTMNTMAVGEEQELKFKGSAVHGGGSCQLSVTTDTEPSKTSKFKVIKSVEGGCPGVDGPAVFKFTLPDSIPNGKATFAWTWFAKLSGGPEMYMNCAPIEVTGGASDTTAFDALPDMLVANIESTTCKSEVSQALKFPDPGTVLEQAGTGSDVKPPTGSCGASGTTPADPSSPAGSGAPASSAAGGQPSAAPSSAGGNDGMYTPPAGAATSVAATAAPSAAISTPAAGPAAPSASSKAAVTSAAATGGAGGVFAPGASSAAPVASTQTTLVTVTGTPTAPSKSTAAASAPAASAPAASAPAASAPAAGTGSSPATPTQAPAAGAGGAGTCTTDGAIVCNGTSQFGLCNQGKVVWQAVAAGTTCSNGTIQKRGFNGRVVRRKRSFVSHVHKH